MDYVDQLSLEEKIWLNKFVGEYYNASYDANNLKNNMHNTPDLKKDCTDRNNWRNNDVYGVSKAQRRLADIDILTEEVDTHKEDSAENIDPSGKERSSIDVEDSLIEYIDSKDFPEDEESY